MKKKPTQEPEVRSAIAAIHLPDKNGCRVTVIQDSILEFPELWMDVHIVGNDYDKSMVQFFAKARCWKARNLESADLVVFTGGPDVNPSLYGCKKVHPKTQISDKRDEQDIAAYWEAVKLGIPMVGICRGAQFLHVMNGGQLFQHIEGHVGPHSMLDSASQRLIQRISSTHHQGCIYNQGMTIVGESLHRGHIRFEGEELSSSKQADIEAYFYRRNCILGFQGHPEFSERGYTPYSIWCLQQVQHYIMENPDIAISDIEVADDNGELKVQRRPRLKKELILNPM